MCLEGLVFSDLVSLMRTLTKCRVTIDGVYPVFEDIASGKYPVSRPLFFYVKKQHLNNISGLREYIKYFISKQMVGEEGATVEKGLIPLPEDEYKSMTERVLAEIK